jgi:hypothetical protein
LPVKEGEALLPARDLPTGNWTSPHANKGVSTAKKIIVVVNTADRDKTLTLQLPDEKTLNSNFGLPLKSVRLRRNTLRSTTAGLDSYWL